MRTQAERTASAKALTERGLSGSFRNSRMALAADVVRENDRSEVRGHKRQALGVTVGTLALHLNGRWNAVGGL